MKLIVSTFLVYKVKKCLLKSGKVKGQKLCILPSILKLLPLQGDKFVSIITQGDALG